MIQVLMAFIGFMALMDVMALIAWMAIIALIDAMAEITRIFIRLMRPKWKIGPLSYLIWQKSFKSMK